MSFESKSLAELKVIAEEWAVDAPQAATKAALLKAIEDEGVTEDAVEALAAAEKVDPADLLPKALKKKKVKKGVATLLVKMTRQNTYFEFGDYVWQKEKPFVLMEENDFEDLLNVYDGFAVATPNEVRSFYDE